MRKPKKGKLKLKSKRGAVKRFKLTATGKVKRGHAYEAPHPHQEERGPEARPAQVDPGLGGRDARPCAACFWGRIIGPRAPPARAIAGASSRVPGGVTACKRGAPAASAGRKRNVPCRESNEETSAGSAARRSCRLAKGYFLTKGKLYRSARSRSSAPATSPTSAASARSATSAACGSSASTPPRALHDMSYSQFIAGLKRAGVDLDRKSLAEIAARDPAGLRRAGRVGAQGAPRAAAPAAWRPRRASRPRPAGLRRPWPTSLDELKDAGPRAPRGVRGRAARGRATPRPCRPCATASWAASPGAVTAPHEVAGRAWPRRRARRPARS